MLRSAALLALMVSLTAFSLGQAVQPRVRVSSGVASGLLKNKVQPTYPPLARQARIQGTVNLKVVINQDGDVQDIALISGHPLLAPAAIDAVKQWKYQPYLLNGVPVNVETQVQVNFALGEKPPADNPVTEKPPAEGSSTDIPGGALGHVLSTVPPSSSADPPRRIRVSSGVSQGLLVKKVDPLYPEAARQQRIQGRVVLKANIDKEGNVSKLELVEGHPMLVPAAIEAVKQWKYRPYILAGNAVEVETQILVNFTLD